MNIFKKLLTHLLSGADEPDPFKDYKAPHAYRGTPQKMKRRRRLIHVTTPQGNFETTGRLFKGHRP